MDDLIIIGQIGINKFKVEMMMFSMSDLALLSYNLGLEVQQTVEGIRIGQASFATKLVERSGMGDCNTYAIPMEPMLKLRKENENPLVDATEYISLVGGLHYLRNTRPDITFEMNYESRFPEKLWEDHMWM